MNLAKLQWTTYDEMTYIDIAIERKAPDAKIQWLINYRNACGARADWGNCSAARVMQYLDDAIDRNRLLAAKTNLQTAK